ncbi:hypothetical protein LZQ00_08515 [Sphingobacterium sp. SRCM116780]|uniref:conjugal transfer protein MobA n=1 Tax=Sphingobacterium sp. SRCM116780 TaxID=2907623 RepID=UPI001F1A3EEC|nr:conjugal transfer protein MobA [Sphingobacterium sp. SRCM116780]UIR57849.1 hypothetical protein LZQ00_08515 [Sphingobacterium sp. SRCM116780]
MKAVRKGGRNPKLNRAVHRYVFRLTDQENSKFLSLFEESGLDTKAKFIVSVLFNRQIRSIKIDAGAAEYTTKLSQFFSQFRAIGVNYNQVVKVLHTNFSDKKTILYIGKLEKQTIELAGLCKEILILSQHFEKEYLLKKENL